jgi:hypothetical protein
MRVRLIMPGIQSAVACAVVKGIPSVGFLTACWERMQMLEHALCPICQKLRSVL